jgi:hypothetical protein
MGKSFSLGAYFAGTQVQGLSSLKASHPPENQESFVLHQRKLENAEPSTEKKN